MDDAGWMRYCPFQIRKPCQINDSINNKWYSVFISFIIFFHNSPPKYYIKKCSFSFSQVKVMELLFALTSPSVCIHKGEDTSIWILEAR